MLRRLIKNKKAQNTAEYAILISLVVAGIIAMQTYAQRALQARVRDASAFLASEGTPGTMAETQQYEPYYLESGYTVDKYDQTKKTLTQTDDLRDTYSNRIRDLGGYQVSKYDTALGLDNGI